MQHKQKREERVCDCRRLNNKFFIIENIYSSTHRYDKV